MNIAIILGRILLSRSVPGLQSFSGGFFSAVIVVITESLPSSLDRGVAEFLLNFILLS